MRGVTILVMIEVDYDYYRFNKVVNVAAVKTSELAAEKFNFNFPFEHNRPVYAYNGDSNDHLDRNEISHYQIQRYDL